MEGEVVTGEQVKWIFEGGLELLSRCQGEIDRLNVFPVPDGDTGRNLYLTMVSAVREMNRVNAPGLGKVSEAVARGSLMGARGNSGVILSQLIRGLAEAVKGKDAVTVVEFARAWQAAVATAYRAVIKPVEGTMLTVAREFARSFVEAALQKKSLEEALPVALEAAGQTLQRTPELLPVLKKAGVVDAGGKGLLVILEGGWKALQEGGRVPPATVRAGVDNSQETRLPVQEEHDFTNLYCVSLVLEADASLINRIRGELTALGDSIVIGGGGGLIKLHMHSNSPGQVLECCLKYGSLHNIEVSNMRDQWEANQATKPAAGCGEVQASGEQPVTEVIAVAAGEGIKKLFTSLGVHGIIEGGQTMNPPVEDFVKAIERVAASRVIILPNNKNLIMAAQQARDLVPKEVGIVPSVSIPAGLAAMLSFNPSLGVAENKEKMTQALNQVKVGEVTYAVRDASIDGTRIKKGDFLGLSQGKLLAAGTSLAEVVCDLTTRLLAPQDELVTLFSGADVSPEEAEQIAEKIRSIQPGVEVEVHAGGQPVYYYLIGVE